MDNLPSWFLYFVNMLPIPEWAKMLIEAAFEIIMMLPWFKRPAALFQLRSACCEAKRIDMKLQGSGATLRLVPLQEWTSKWKPLAESTTK